MLLFFPPGVSAWPQQKMLIPPRLCPWRRCRNTCVEGGAAAAGEVFPAFPSSLGSFDAVHYRGGKKFAVGSVRRSLAHPPPNPGPRLSQTAGSARLQGARRWEEGRRGETEGFLWPCIHLSQLINLTFTPSFSCKAPERFGDLREQREGQNPHPPPAQNSVSSPAGQDESCWDSRQGEGCGRIRAEGSSWGCQTEPGRSIHPPANIVVFGILLWPGRNEMEPGVVWVVQGCSFFSVVKAKAFLELVLSGLLVKNDSKS